MNEKKTISSLINKKLSNNYFIGLSGPVKNSKDPTLKDSPGLFEACEIINTGRLLPDLLAATEEIFSLANEEEKLDLKLAKEAAQTKKQNGVKPTIRKIHYAIELKSSATFLLYFYFFLTDKDVKPLSKKKLQKAYTKALADFNAVIHGDEINKNRLFLIRAEDKNLFLIKLYCTMKNNTPVLDLREFYNEYYNDRINRELITLSSLSIESLKKALPAITIPAATELTIQGEKTHLKLNEDTKETSATELVNALNKTGIKCTLQSEGWFFKRYSISMPSEETRLKIIERTLSQRSPLVGEVNKAFAFDIKELAFKLNIDEEWLDRQPTYLDNKVRIYFKKNVPQAEITKITNRLELANVPHHYFDLKANPYLTIDAENYDVLLNVLGNHMDKSLKM